MAGPFQMVFGACQAGQPESWRAPGQAIFDIQFDIDVAPE